MNRLSTRKLPVVQHPIPEGHTMNIVFLNVRSYLEHLLDLRMTKVVTQSNVICFAETFLIPRCVIRDNRLITGDMNQIVRQDRDPAEGQGQGGLMIMSKSHMIEGKHPHRYHSLE